MNNRSNIMGWFARAFMALVLLISCKPCNGFETWEPQLSQVDVSTIEQLIRALNDVSVDHIRMIPKVWNFTDAELPYHAAVISNRTVMLEGYGDQQVYIDGNKLTQRVLVTDGGMLIQRNLWVDDCYITEMPFTCFSETTNKGSKVLLQDTEMSDAACIDIQHSPGITAMLWTAKYAKLRSITTKQHSARSIHVADTGWIPFVPPGAEWRLINVNLTCTGNTTHPLPLEWTPPAQGPSFGIFILIIFTTGVAIAASCSAVVTKKRGGLMSSAAHCFRPDYQVAILKSVTLQQQLSSGLFGRVYKAIHTPTGDKVAVKVVTLTLSDKQEVQRVVTECQLMRKLNHPNITRMLFYHSVLLEDITQGSQGGYVYVQGPKEYRIIDNTTAPLSDPSTTTATATTTTGSKAANKLEAIVAKLLRSNPGEESRSSIDSHSSQGNSTQGLGSSSSGGYVPDFMGLDSEESGLDDSLDEAYTLAKHHYEKESSRIMLQIQLVMEFCELDTLYGAVRRGRFHHRGLPDMSKVLLTALDIARGVEFLHSSKYRVVHRDITPSNVLLSKSKNHRGFTAKLSDFGLSTIVPSGVSHKTTGVKGTVAYMPPEAFTEDCVSMQLDIYSLGVLLYYIASALEPYAGMTTGVVLRKKRDGSQEEFIFNNSLAEVIPEAYQDLVLECTNFSRDKRPTAVDIAQRLHAMVIAC